jgi:high-affinity iron transporter
MIGSLIIVFREVIEAGLIIGIVLAVTRNVPGRTGYVVGGALAGLAGAGIVAASAGLLSSALNGIGQEMFNAAILGIAVVMLTWHNIWMAKHGREMAAELRGVGEDVSSGARSLLALAIVVAIAVLREGSEVALFLYGIVIQGGESGISLLAGGVAGLALGAALSALTFAGLVTIPMRALFRVTTALIAFMAAGMAAQSVAFLQQAGFLEKYDRTVWDTSAVLSETSIAGKIVHTLFGYVDQPNIAQLTVYVAVLALTYVLMKIASPNRIAQRPLVAGE